MPYDTDDLAVLLQTPSSTDLDARPRLSPESLLGLRALGEGEPGEAGESGDGAVDGERGEGSGFGPTKLVGPATLTDKTGKDVSNPVFEFDGAYAPNS